VPPIVRNTRSKTAKAVADSEIESSHKISTDSGANVCVVMKSSVKSSETKGLVAQGDAPLKSSSAKPLAKEGEGDDENEKVIATLMDNAKLIANSMVNSKVKPCAKEGEEDVDGSSSSDEGSSSSEEDSSGSDEDTEVFEVTSTGFGVDKFNNFFLEAVRTFESTALFNTSHQTNATWLKYACAAALASCVVPGIAYMKKLESCNWTSLNTAVKQLLSYTGLDKQSMKILKALCKDKVVLKNRDDLLTVALKYEGLIVRNFKTNIDKFLANPSLNHVASIFEKI